MDFEMTGTRYFEIDNNEISSIRKQEMEKLEWKKRSFTESIFEAK
jgi:hypothetical protein